MNGKLLLNALEKALEEDTDSSFLDDLISYQNLNEAAFDFVIRTKALTATQSITTVADTANYTLDAEYMGLYMRNNYNQYTIKYNDGSNNTFLTWKPYEDIIWGDNTTSVAYPSHFTVVDEPSLASLISSTTTSAGAASNGRTTLTDTGSDFSNVEAHDIVDNTTDGSTGYVISKTSTTVLVTALFGGTANDYTSGDSYVIQPQGRFRLVLDPPPSTAGHTITVYYLQRPAPVYSSYDVFRFPTQYSDALVKYAAWLYKYRDGDPNFGDKWFTYYERMVRKFSHTVDHTQRRNWFEVNLRARRPW